MSARIEELAWQDTPMGEINLRRRRDPELGVEIYEVKLGEEFLMSSLFTVAEIELAHLALGEAQGADLDVLVGGLGLGYTAQAVLEHSRVRSLTVIEALPAVIDWHRRELLPVSTSLVTDERTRLVNEDYFALMRREPEPNEWVAAGYHAIIVDIDHSPRHLLSSGHADFYTEEGLRRLSRHLAVGGVFALWSDDAPDQEFEAVLARVFTATASHVVSFDNPITGGVSANTVYVASAPLA